MDDETVRDPQGGGEAPLLEARGGDSVEGRDVVHGDDDRSAPAREAQDEGVGEREGQPLEVCDDRTVSFRPDQGAAVDDVFDGLQRRAGEAVAPRRGVEPAIEAGLERRLRRRLPCPRRTTDERRG